MTDKTKLKICRWCGADAELIRAHIIPEAFHALSPGADKRVAILSPDDSKFTRVRQAGITDPGILCGPCDRLLGKLDEFALTVFRSPPAESDAVQVGPAKGYDLHCSDIPRAQRFLLSVLWRASVSSDSTFELINLPLPDLDRIRKLILSEQIPDEGEFEFLAIRYDKPYFEGGFLPPWTSKAGTVPVYNLALPCYQFMIRINRGAAIFPRSIVFRHTR